ncbi:MAG: tetratricopeptide repeat protein [Candidatus Obscuribacterales bacterium]|nr:tetratricopeptide repeat protein [Candidatus Obscuribacterales bacterium]
MWERYNVAGQQAMSAGKHKDAEEHFKLALKEAETYGENDAKLPTSLNNLANCLRSQGRLSEAEPLYQRALQVKEKALGPFHKDLMVILENYATLLKVSNRENEAAKLERRAQGIFKMS